MWTRRRARENEKERECRLVEREKHAKQPLVCDATCALPSLFQRDEGESELNEREAGAREEGKESEKERESAEGRERKREVLRTCEKET